MLEAAMIALASAAGTAMVQAMVSDGWTTLRTKIAKLLGQNDQQREQQIREQLDATRESVLSGQVDRAVAAGRWQGRLETLLEDHPHVAPELSKLVESIGQLPATQAVNVQRVTAGNRARVNHAGRDIDNSRRTHFGGPLAVFAVLAVLLIMGGWGAVKVIGWVGDLAGPTITENTSCREYLQASTEERDQAVKTIGVKKGVADAGHPWARHNVDYSCGHQPDTPVGRVIG